MSLRLIRSRLLVLGLWAGLLTLAGCSLFVPRKPAPVAAPPAAAGATPAVPDEGYSRYGNPETYKVLGQTYRVLKSGNGFVERGIASWYGPDFHGKLTSTREVYDMYQMSAAHKLLPLPTWVKVTNLENGRHVVLRVNDRGPFKDNRIIDLSYAAALKLDVIAKGTAFVEIQAIDRPDAELSGGAVIETAKATKMYLQVGAFGDPANAERLRAKADAATDEPIRVVQAKSNGRTLFRVQIGPLADVDRADAAVQALANAGISEHQFINQ